MSTLSVHSNASLSGDSTVVNVAFISLDAIGVSSTDTLTALKGTSVVGATVVGEGGCEWGGGIEESG